MRLSELIGTRVIDSNEQHVGFVQDVRAEQDGPLLGSWGAAIAVKGLIVSRGACLHLDITRATPRARC
jgi:hypothetical protein